MNELLAWKAEALARRPVSMFIMQSETTDGEPIITATGSDLDCCMGQGETTAEAVEDLMDARTSMIYHDLLNGLPLPMDDSLGWEPWEPEDAE
jgi:predicted RNase H-like HicB family nuclease